MDVYHDSLFNYGARGYFSVKKSGQATITATSSDGGYKATCVVYVTVKEKETSQEPVRQDTKKEPGTPPQTDVSKTSASKKKPAKVTVRQPSGLKVSNIKKKKAKIVWKAAKDVTGYQIYRSTKKNSGYKKIRTITKKSKVTYTDPGLRLKKTYYYKIRSYKKVKGKTFYSSFSKPKSVKVKK